MEDFRESLSNKAKRVLASNSNGIYAAAEEFNGELRECLAFVGEEPSEQIVEMFQWCRQLIEKHDILIQVCGWDFFIIFSPFAFSRCCGKDAKELLIKTAHKCNPREMFTAIMEGFGLNEKAEIFTLLISLLNITLNRIPSSRMKFLPQMWRSVQVALDMSLSKTIEDHQHQAGNDNNNSIITASMVQSSGPLALKCDAPFVLLLDECLKMVLDLIKHTEQNAAAEKQFVCGIILELFAMYATIQPFESLINRDKEHWKLMNCLQDCVGNVMRVFGSEDDCCHNETNKENSEDEMMEEDDDDLEEATILKEKPPIGNVLSRGIFCCVSLQPKDECSWPFIPAAWTSKSIVKLAWPLATSLLSSARPGYGDYGLMLIQNTVHDMELNALNESQFPVMPLLQGLIHQMVHCPIETNRNLSYKTLQLVLECTTPPSRYVLLNDLIQQCPFPSVVSLLIHIVKEQIAKSWPPAHTEKSQLPSMNEAPFLVAAVSILTPCMIPPSKTALLLSRSDIVLTALNVYRFLLIRDKNSNYTGVWSKETVEDIQSRCVGPLQRAIADIREKGNAQALAKTAVTINQQMTQQDHHPDDIKGLQGPTQSQDLIMSNNVKVAEFQLFVLEDVLGRVIELLQEGNK